MTKTAQDYVLDWLAAHGPEEWHRVAVTWNWDAGYRILNWIVDQSACDKGTALHLFWLGCPDYFLKFRDRDDVVARSPISVENYDFLVRVLTHWAAGRYPTAAFATEGVGDAASAFRHVEAEHAAKGLPWVVPADMRRDIQGRVIEHPGYAEGYSPALQAKLNAEGIPF